MVSLYLRLQRLCETARHTEGDAGKRIWRKQMTEVVKLTGATSISGQHGKAINRQKVKAKVDTGLHTQLDTSRGMAAMTLLSLIHTKITRPD